MSKRLAPKKTKKTKSTKAASKERELRARRAKRKKAVAAKAAAAAQAAEQAAESTLAFTPAPVEVVVVDPSKAPGKQHRHPPVQVHGVRQSEAYVPKVRTPFNRRMNIGR